jgi:hypothetical protein
MQSFPIPPAAGKSLWILWGAMLLMVAIMALLGWVAWSAKHSRAEVGGGELRLVGDLWGRRIPIERLALGDARIIDLRSEPDLQPARRTMGTAMGGFASGWFRLRDGSKALLYLTDRTRVVYVPTREDYTILLSSHEPERLLAALRAEAGGSGGGDETGRS